MYEVKKRSGMIIRLSLQPLIQLLPGLFYIANLIRMLMITSAPYLASLCVFGIFGILMAFFQRRIKTGRIWLFFIFYMITLVANWIMIGNVSFNSIAVNIFLIGITFIMLLRQWTYREGAAVFYITALIFLYYMNKSSYKHILISSTNYISVLMLLAAAFYYIAVDLDRRKLRLIDLLPAVICFMMSVWALGRGGILSTAILLVLLLLLYLLTVSKKNVIQALLIVLLVFAVGVFLLLKNINLMDTFMSLGKWDTHGADNSARMQIWGSYLSEAGKSIPYFLFGVSLQTTQMLNSVGGNCHNSFLQLHAYNGILFFICFFVFLIKAFFYYWKKKRFVMLVMLAVLVVRGMTDKFIFGQYGMPIMLFFVLYPLIDRQRAANKSTDSAAVSKVD